MRWKYGCLFRYKRHKWAALFVRKRKGNKMRKIKVTLSSLVVKTEAANNFEWMRVA
jgi:hypothetical protein